MFHVTLTEREGNRWYPSGKYHYHALRDARASFDAWKKVLTDLSTEGPTGMVLHDGERVIDHENMTEREAARNGTGTVNNLRMKDGKWPS